MVNPCSGFTPLAVGVGIQSARKLLVMSGQKRFPDLWPCWRRQVAACRRDLLVVVDPDLKTVDETLDVMDLRSMVACASISLCGLEPSHLGTQVPHPMILRQSASGNAKEAGANCTGQGDSNYRRFHLVFPYTKARTMFENAVTIPSELKEILVAVPKTLSGAIRFKGTRVPVHALIDTLDAGQGIEGFLDSWPNVPRGQAEAVIHWEQNVSCQPLGLDLVAGCG